ncbi:hypothetical protein JCM10207_003262 [Rhodosporidiobolus poonsookiae]
MAQPTALFNSAALDVLLPVHLPDSPPSTSLASVHDAAESARTDAWVSTVLSAPQRTSLYHDERLSFVLVAVLPPTSLLSRSQAAAFFLRSLGQPHLNLTADLTYVEGARTAPRTPSISTFQHQQGAPALPPPRGTSLGVLANKVPLTPSPFPESLPEEGADAAGALPGIPVANVAFDEDEGRVWVGKDGEGRWVALWLMEATVSFVRSQLVEPKLSLTVTLTLRDDPRLEHVLERAKEGVLLEGGASADEGDVLEDDEYMDDNYDNVNLLAGLSPISSTPLHLPFSRLPTSCLPPLPAPTVPTHRSTRSRSYSLTSGSTPLHPSLRRSSRRILPIHSAIQVQMRTVPCPVGALGVSDGARVWERDDEDGVVLCVETSGAPSTSSSSGSSDGFEVESIEVHIEGGAQTGGLLGPGREQHDVEVRPVFAPGVAFPLRVNAGGNTQHNFLYAVASVPSAAGSPDRHTLTLPHADELHPHETVPIAVASSPSQRFTARFGAEEISEQATATVVGEIALRRGSLAPPMVGAEGAKETWLRRVAIVVKGRPYVGRRPPAGLTGGGGYDVPGAETGAEQADSPAEEDEKYPTAAFQSRWNCTLDISSFARRSPPRTAVFAHPARPGPARPTSIGAPPPHPAATTALRAPLPPPAMPRALPRPSSVPSNAEVESVAGSKRHTVASLAALSLKSPALNRRGSSAFPGPPAQLEQRRPSRALPPTPLSPPAPPSVFTPGATGPPKRFFSLPHGDTSASSDINVSPSLAGLVAAPQRTETPPPMSSPLDPSRRTSAPVAGTAAERSTNMLSAVPERPKDTRRTSWMSSLVGGGGSSSASSSPQVDTPPVRATSLNVSAGGGTSWDRASAQGSTVGLGLEDVPAPGAPALAAVPETAQPFRPVVPPPPHQQQGLQLSQPQGGNLLVSVSLVPLRQAKSRRQPFLGTPSPSQPSPSTSTSVGRTNENLPPPTLPGLAPSSPDPTVATPRTAFTFPSAPSSPNPSGSSTPASPLAPLSPAPPADPATEARLAAERTNLLTSRMPRVNVLDVFLVEVFIQNQSDRVKRFTVGVPPPLLAGAAQGKVRTDARGAKEEKVATLVPLENDVRIGPLAPHTCASVGIRFLAIRPGSHCVDQLRLVDLSDGSETRLDGAVWVVVE